MANCESFAIFPVSSPLASGTRQHADIFRLGQRQELLGGLVAKQIENDLHGFDVGIFDCLQRLIDELYAHAVMFDLAFASQIIEPAENFGS